MTGTSEDGHHRAATEHAQHVARRIHGPPAGPAPGPVYVGLVTRVIAFVVDAAILNIIAAVVAGGVALVLSVFPVSHNLSTPVVAVGGFVFFAWVIAYFAVFWATTGQTPGNRVMQIRVARPNGAPLKSRRAVLRVAGLFLAALPLFAGFVPILLTDRRRGLADWIADTVVVRAVGAPQLGELDTLVAETGVAAAPPALDLIPGPAVPPGPG